MKYDFTSLMDRNGHDALAVDAFGKDFAQGCPKEGFDVIPMWVADMNFPTVPSVCRAISERIEHPAFGYYIPREEYYQSIIRWQSVRNGVQGLRSEHIGYHNGVLGGLVSAINTFASRGDSILIHSPTYMGFTGSLENAGYHLVHSPLILDESGTWRMDFDDMEKKLATHHIHAAVFCSPHNPTGRVWEEWEIRTAMELFRKYDVFVVSDEIWSDIILGDHKHIPTQCVSEDAKERTVAMYAPSKTFNLAGLIGAYHIIYNPRLRDRVNKEASLSHYNAMNVLSMYALMGAYSREGEEWVDELCATLTENVNDAYDFLTKRIPGIRASRPEGTYMIFLDVSAWLRMHERTLDDLLRAGWEVGVAWQDGRNHGGPTHIRMNVALPKSRVMEAMDRLERYVFTV